MLDWLAISDALITSTGEAEVATERSVRRVPNTTTVSTSLGCASATGAVVPWANAGPEKSAKAYTRPLVSNSFLCNQFLFVFMS